MSLEEIREALQEHLPNDGDDLGILRTYVVIAEWTAPDGTQYITRMAGDLNDEGPAIWTVKGLLYHSLETVQRDADAHGESE